MHINRYIPRRVASFPFPTRETSTSSLLRAGSTNIFFNLQYRSLIFPACQGILSPDSEELFSSISNPSWGIGSPASPAVSLVLSRLGDCWCCRGLRPWQEISKAREVAAEGGAIDDRLSECYCSLPLRTCFGMLSSLE